MISINSTLTIYVLIPLPILLPIIVYFVSSQINKKVNSTELQLSVLTSSSQENFSAINIIKIFRNEKNSYEKFLKECKEYKTNN